MSLLLIKRRHSTHTKVSTQHMQTKIEWMKRAVRGVATSCARINLTDGSHRGAGLRAGQFIKPLPLTALHVYAPPGTGTAPRRHMMEDSESAESIFTQ